MTGSQPSRAQEVAADVVRLRILLVNLFFIGEPGATRDWVLVDTGLGHCADRIAKTAEERFGAEAKPKAIILTHGHVDHIGAVAELAGRWKVPVYAHELELPYLTGRSNYPPGDPSVGGGLNSWLSFAYRRKAIDLGESVSALPNDGSVPFLPAWRWIHTPGHTPGHVSLFRDKDKVLLAGDAVITTKQESLLSVLLQARHVRRPPAYFTIDWDEARRSVRQLAALHPAVLATGHGHPMRGETMEEQLQTLARDFNQIGIPAHGRYVEEPAIADETGILSVPLPAPSAAPKILAGAALAAVALALWSARRGRRED